MNRHVPVLLSETLAAFETAPGGVLVDGTLGGGGHTRALVEHFPGAKVLACDRDPAAIAGAQENLATFVEQHRLAFFTGNFAHVFDNEALLPEGYAPPWSGVLLDLGYSSNQLEDPAYGMSFQTEGPLDMRLSRDGQSAWELLLESSDEELAEIFKAYGEMPGSHRIARRIKSAIDDGALTNSTRSLAQLLQQIAGPAGRSSKIHPATLVFQALRIAVNDELRALDHFLNNVILRLRASAVVGIITFHSLEDRIVKQWARKNDDQLEATTRKPIVAGAEELKANPRSRSAKLRVYRKK